MNPSINFQLRMPGEPEPNPVHEPPNPPESPDLPIREPEPEEPQVI